jgi:hypothetical protein
MFRREFIDSFIPSWLRGFVASWLGVGATANIFGSPACFVGNEWGQKMQKRFFDDLLLALEKIQPGVSSVI